MRARPSAAARRIARQARGITAHRRSRAGAAAQAARRRPPATCARWTGASRGTRAALRLVASATAARTRRLSRRAPSTARTWSGRRATTSATYREASPADRRAQRRATLPWQQRARSAPAQRDRSIPRGRPRRPIRHRRAAPRVRELPGARPCGVLDHTAPPTHRRERGSKAAAVVAEHGGVRLREVARRKLAPPLARRVRDDGVRPGVEARVAGRIPRVDVVEAVVRAAGLDVERCNGAHHGDTPARRASTAASVSAQQPPRGPTVP